MDFDKRLFSHILGLKISNADLSRATGISTARISNFCNGKDMPSLTNALILCNYFKCSVDYLFGLSDEYILIVSERRFNKDAFLKSLEKLMKEQGISQREICKSVGLNKSCISNWKKGQKPTAKNLIKLANFLHCSMDDLLGFEIGSVK
ncbi:MAG: helix-turn-helix domain-containing protein [Candidatus Caccovivens sp.]